MSVAGAGEIDGTITTATGAALAHDGPGYALVGDLTFLHEANGAAVAAAVGRPVGDRA